VIIGVAGAGQESAPALSIAPRLKVQLVELEGTMC